jgi:MtN3 and saliva related transmembrane protein
MGAIAAAVTVYGVVMALAPGLQVRRMLRERSAAGVSLAYAGVLWVGFALWLAYGIDAGDLPLILANTVALGATGAMILVARRVRRAEQATEPAAVRTPAASAPPRG